VHWRPDVDQNGRVLSQSRDSRSGAGNVPRPAATGNSNVNYNPPCDEQKGSSSLGRLMRTAPPTGPPVERVNRRDFYSIIYAPEQHLAGTALQRGPNDGVGPGSMGSPTRFFCAASWPCATGAYTRMRSRHYTRRGRALPLTMVADQPDHRATATLPPARPASDDYNSTQPVRHGPMSASSRLPRSSTVGRQLCGTTVAA